MNFKLVLAFFGIYVFWGSNFAFIKLGLDSFSPFMLSGVRYLIASLIFLSFSYKRVRKLKWEQFKKDIIIGILLCVSNAGVCFAQEYVSSGIAAILVGTLPIFFILFNYLGFDKKIPHITSIIGIIVGIVGIFIISSDKANVDSYSAIFALIISNILWVIGSLYMKRHSIGRSYFERASTQLSIGGLFLILISLLFENESIHALDLNALTSMSYLVIFGTLFGYTCYDYLIRTTTPEIASTYAIVNPVVAILVGVVFLHEYFSSKIAFASPLILLSIALVLYGEKWLKKIRTLKQGFTIL